MMYWRNLHSIYSYSEVPIEEYDVDQGENAQRDVHIPFNFHTLIILF